MSPDGGTAIRSVAEGVVAFVGWNPWDSEGRAFIIVVGHPDGYHSRYGHLQPTRQVRVGQMVRKGEIIGRMGSTGKSTGVHLHMELLDRSGTVDPLRYFPPRQQDGSLDSQASARGNGAHRAASERRKAGSKGRKPAAKRSKASKVAGKGGKRNVAGKSRVKASKGARSRAAQDAKGARDGAMTPWVLSWPEPCELQDAIGSLPGTRKRMDVAGLAEGPVSTLDTEAADHCETPDGPSILGRLHEDEEERVTPHRAPIPYPRAEPTAL